MGLQLFVGPAARSPMGRAQDDVKVYYLARVLKFIHFT